jgi:hypothetical protein
VLANVPFELAIKQARPVSDDALAIPSRCRAARLVSSGCKNALAAAWPTLRSRVGPERAGKADVGFGAEGARRPNVRHALLHDRALSAGPDLEENLGLIAAARSAGPMPGGRGREQLRDLS